MNALRVGVDIETREEVGVKFEHMRTRKPQLAHEFKVMALLEGHRLSTTDPSLCLCAAFHVVLMLLFVCV